MEVSVLPATVTSLSVTIVFPALLPLPAQLQVKFSMEVPAHAEMGTTTMDLPVLLVLPTVWPVLQHLPVLPALGNTL